MSNSCGIFGKDTSDELILSYFLIDNSERNFIKYFENTDFELYRIIASGSKNHFYKNRIRNIKKDDNYNFEDSINDWKHLMKNKDLGNRSCDDTVYIIKDGWWHICQPPEYYMIKKSPVFGVNVEK